MPYGVSTRSSMSTSRSRDCSVPVVMMTAMAASAVSENRQIVRPRPIGSSARAEGITTYEKATTPPSQIEIAMTWR